MKKTFLLISTIMIFSSLFAQSKKQIISDLNDSINLLNTQKNDLLYKLNNTESKLNDALYEQLDLNKRNIKLIQEKKLLQNKVDSIMTDKCLLNLYSYSFKSNRGYVPSYEQILLKAKELMESNDCNSQKIYKVLYEIDYYNVAIFNKHNKYLLRDLLDYFQKEKKDWSSIYDFVEDFKNNKYSKSNTDKELIRLSWYKKLTDLDLYRNGVTIRLSEGEPYFSFSNSFKYETLKDVENQPLKDYIYLSYKHDDWFIDDMALLLSFEELAYRLHDWSIFLKKYPNFEFKDEIEREMNILLNVLIKELDNVEMYNYNTLKFHDSILNSYKLFTSINNTEYSTAIKKWLNHLNSNNNRFDSINSPKIQNEILKDFPIK